MQLDLFAQPPVVECPAPTLADLLSYDFILVAFSGGKDSIACYLKLREMGVPAHRIELHHHRIDGNEGSSLMDWPVTDAYCQAFAAAMGSPIYFSWREGGFEREMLRNNQATAGVRFQRPDGMQERTGGKSLKLNTRRKFPQVSADLSVRWCSAYLKIMVMNAAVAAQPRFKNKRTIILTGERAQESTARAKYKVFEPHYYLNCKKRKVDHWRAVHALSEKEVWEMMARWMVRPHPCYFLGWGRCSCAACIFGNKNQFASLYEIAQGMVEKIIAYEKEFGVTIKRNTSVETLVEIGLPYTMDPETIKLAMGWFYDLDIIVTGEWLLPQGAFNSKHADQLKT